MSDTNNTFSKKSNSMVLVSKILQSFCLRNEVNQGHENRAFILKEGSEMKDLS